MPLSKSTAGMEVAMFNSHKCWPKPHNTMGLCSCTRTCFTFQHHSRCSWIKSRKSVLWLIQQFFNYCLPINPPMDGGGGHWLVRIEWCPAEWSVCLPLLIIPCTIKSRSSLLAPAHPGGPGKRAVKRLCVYVVYCLPIKYLRSHWQLAMTPSCQHHQCVTWVFSYINSDASMRRTFWELCPLLYCVRSAAFVNQSHSRLRFERSSQN